MDYCKSTPCYECTQRNAGCHINCPAYRVYAMDREAQRAERLRGYLTNNDCEASRRRIINLNKHHSRR